METRFVVEVARRAGEEENPHLSKPAGVVGLREASVFELCGAGQDEVQRLASILLRDAALEKFGPKSIGHGSYENF